MKLDISIKSINLEMLRWGRQWDHTRLRLIRKSRLKSYQQIFCLAERLLSLLHHLQFRLLDQQLGNWIHSITLKPNEHKLHLMYNQFQGLYKNERTFLNDNDSNNHTIDTQDTSHDNWNNGFHNKIGFKDTHGADTNSCFGTTVSSA